MIKLGIVDFDTSHCVEFTKRLNHIEIDEELWVEGAQIVAGWTGPSEITEPERLEQFTKTLRDDFKIPIVDKPEDMIGQVDGILVQSQGGQMHLERAAPFLEAGVPCYVDKPFACSVADAKALAELAASKNLPIFSASSLRYGLEVQELMAEGNAAGAVMGAETYSPCSLHPGNPGMYHYGIHSVETLYALMGPGCKSVRTTWQEDTEVTVGVWADGRIGSVRGLRAGSRGLGFTAYCEKAVVAKAVNARYIYRELLKKIVSMFETGKSPLPIEETIEIVAFIEAAIKSQNEGGSEVAL